MNHAARIAESIESAGIRHDLETASPYVGDSPYVHGGCRGCAQCAGDAKAHGHRFGALLVCVKCGIEHSAFHAKPAQCEPQPGDHSDADQAFSWATRGAS